MRRKLMRVLLCTAIIAITAVYQTERAQATPASAGYKATTIANGTFGEIQVFNQLSKNMLPDGFEGNVWVSLQKTKGPSDLYVQNNVWQPAGSTACPTPCSTGWHTHPGHSLIIVTAGTVTEYEEDCTPHVYVKGDTFVDPGGGHVHILRNESTTDVASTVAVQLIPQKAVRRIDAPAPENCQSIL
jgi:quercetin dioxygenase-like cupin family protein